nr:PREDICTED: prosaposin isoform X1 [Latimeria chalumnae]|eukprot:XP_014343936.1 PREDICTED: prosaposin isoform X1 [Latimeria chalumnae]
MVGLLALLFVSTAVAGPLLKQEQCAKGPEFWCQNVKTASQCGAVKHCQQTVWNKPVVKSVPCDLCKEVLTVVDNLLKDKATEVEIKEYLDKACKLIPDEGLSAECQEYVDSYLPALLDIIKGELENPQVPCSALGLCQSMQKALAQQDVLSNEIPEDHLSNISPFIANVPLLLYPQENSKGPNAAATPKPPNDGDVCQSCVQFVADAQAAIRANASFAQNLILQVQKQCDDLGPGMSDICKDYVSQYAPVVIQTLLNMGQKPKDLCTQAGFCQSLEAIPLLTLTPAKMIPATKIEKPAKKLLMKVQDSPECVICEFVMKEIEELLEDNRTETSVVHAIQKVCSILPSSISQQCKDFIEAYGKAIMELLVQQMDPKVVCSTLGLCKGAERLYVEKIDPAVFKTGGFCEVCETMVSYLDGILEENSTQAEIEDALKKVCSFLPEKMRSQCDQLIAQYEPDIMQLVLQMLDPEFVCTHLGACGTAKVGLLGKEQCVWGPSYWCKNMETAARCNAVEHCKNHVWN